MGVGDVLRIIMIVAGVMLFAIALSSLARRKINESFSLTWGLVAVIFILGGILLRPYEINKYVSVTGLLLITVVGLCVVFGAFYITAKVSEVTRKNQELSIQVTLLNHENRMIMEKLEALQKEKE